MNWGISFAAQPGVFISYAREDVRLARELHEVLESGGHKVWRDEDRLFAGDPFYDKIKRALDETPVVLVLWSQHSLLSKWVTHEASCAIQADKQIFVRTSEFRPTDLPGPYSSFNCVELALLLADPSRLRETIKEAASRPKKSMTRRAVLRRGLVVGGAAAAAAVPLFPALRILESYEAAHASKKLFALLGLDSNPIVVFGDKYLNYPKDNAALLTDRFPSSAEATAKVISELAEGLDWQRVLKTRSSSSQLKAQSGDVNLLSFGRFVDQRAPPLWLPNQIPASIIAVGSAKTNLVTRQLLGYWTREFEPKFVAMDGSWRAKLVIDQMVDHRRKAAVADPYARGWSRFDTKLMIDGQAHDFQKMDHFVITRLVEPYGRDPRQQVSIISARHRPGQIAARRLFQLPGEPDVKVFVEQLYNRCRHLESWQAWAEVEYQVRPAQDFNVSDFKVIRLSLKDVWPIDTIHAA
jgi:TIR domain